MFHHWMVASMPPLKHCSPLEVIANDNTGPLSHRERSKESLNTCHEHQVTLCVCVCVNVHMGSECVDWFHIKRGTSENPHDKTGDE